MSEIIDYLKEVNLNNPENLLRYIFTSNTQELIGLVAYMRKLIDEEYSVPKYNPFTFVPNDELSGVGGCSSLECKMERAHKFSIFSTMYADDVYIQLNLITSPHNSFEIEDIEASENSSYNFRYLLLCDISIINAYSKLIEFGIVHITPSKKLYCRDCFQQAILGLEQPINVDQIKNSLKNKIEIVIDNYEKETNELAVKINNMDEFFSDHGQTFVVPDKEMIRFPEYIRKPGIVITDRDYINNFLDDFIDNEFISICYLASYCKSNNAKFITTKISDSIFMGLTKDKDLINYDIKHYNTLPQYDLPYIEQVSIEKALHLREIEGESFNKYRIALNKACEEQCKTDSKVEWKQIYDDILYPAFNDLDMKLKSIKNGFYRKTFASMILVGSVITVGVYTGLVPRDTSKILESAGGLGGLVAGGNMFIDRIINNNEPIKENDYYFLWRLKNE